VDGEVESFAVVVVHVAGAVNSPGVYVLPEGSRVVNAVEAAGGVTEAAAADAVNLARLLVDGERVYVPTRQEVRGCGALFLGATPESRGTAGQAGRPGPASEPAEAWGGAFAPRRKINLNTATLSELESLPGIGPTIAARIIDYRTRHGPFTTTEELMNIQGIGEKRFAELADLVTAP
jgi:competence protein ComEA